MLETDPRKDLVADQEVGKIEAAETGKRHESPGRLSLGQPDKKKPEH